MLHCKSHRTSNLQRRVVFYQVLAAFPAMDFVNIQKEKSGVAVHDSPWLKTLSIWYRYLRPAALSVEEFGCTVDEDSASLMLNQLIHMHKEETYDGWSWTDWSLAYSLIRDIRSLVVGPSPTPVTVRENLNKI